MRYSEVAGQRAARRVRMSPGACAAIITTLAWLSSCASPPHRMTPAQPSVAASSSGDEAAAHRVYVALNEDPMYFFRHVDVRVDDGMAYLSGYVWSSDAIYRARQIARNVPGVRGVVTSHLELERNGFSYGPAR